MDYNARYYSPYLGRFISPDSIVPEPGNPQSLNRYSYSYGNPIKYVDSNGHFAIIPAILIAATIVVVGMAMDPADVLAPNNELAVSHPPLNPGYHPAPYVRDFENGAYAAGVIGVATEFVPLNDVPGVKQITKGAGKAVVEAMRDFGWKASFIQSLRPQQYRSFGGTWGALAEMADEGKGTGKLFSYYNEAGEITGAIQLANRPHSSGALEIWGLEGLGGGAGTALFKQAVHESQQNFSGGTFLHATDEAYDWYMKFKPTKVEGNNFYWSPEDAAKLLE